MSEKKAGYQEGHRRETRKSYQAYIDEISSVKPDDDAVKTEPLEDSTSDDSSIRRSKRTPVPKRNFKLIDDFDNKKEQTPKKKKERKSKSTTPTPTKAGDDVDAVTAEVKEESEPVFSQPPYQTETEEQKGISVSEEISTADDQDDEEEVAPRKSGRVRKPKEFKDSVTPSYVKKSVERSKKTSKTDEGELSEPVEQPNKKQSSRKRKISELKKTSNIPVEAVDADSLTDIKEEVFSEPSQPEDSQTEEDIIPTKKRRRSRSSTSKVEESVTVCPTKTRQRRGGNTSTDDTVTLKKDVPPIKLKIKPMAAPSKAIGESEDDKKKIKKKERKKKPTGKLIVSFKKKTSERKASQPTTDTSSQDDDSQAETVAMPLPIKQEPAPTPEKAAPVTTDTEPSAPSSAASKKVKSKKKSKNKKKLDQNNQKVVDVQTFEVVDPSIVKVKKKKIYKKRHGSKVLVRIIKNHCNKSGDVVKTETVLVDSVPVEDDAEDKEDAEDTQVPMEEGEVDQGIQQPEPDEEEEEREEKTRVESDNQMVKDETEDDVQTERNKRSKKDDKKKIKPTLGVKKGGEVTKRIRKSGKNVTVGGKVVGKTTKGLIKTGNKDKQIDLSALKKPCPCCTGKLLKITEPGPALASSSEPKNAYNLFCRKYRPIIVANHPRADFSEISRRLAAIWNNASKEDRAGYFEVFNKMECAFRSKLAKLGRLSPTTWSDAEFQYIKKAISHDLPFKIPAYPQTRLQPVDMAAHLQILGDALGAVGGALQQQSSMTVNGAMSLLMDSMICALGPLICLTSFVPELKGMEVEEMSKTMDNISYILPGL